MGKKAGGTKTGTRNTGSGRGQGGNRPSGGRNGGANKRRNVVVVKPGPNWAMIGLYSVVGVVVLALAGFIGYRIWDTSRTMADRAEAIDGVVNFRATTDLGRNHVDGDQNYGQTPPVGGDHNTQWETCTGIVYTQQIPDEHAVHSLEHGAIWIAYSPDLPADQVEKLAKRVEGKDYTLMSPYPGLDKPISLQAWGFQLKLDSADDPRIDQFIDVLRLNASVETGATCNGGVQATGATPTSGTPGM